MLPIKLVKRGVSVVPTWPYLIPCNHQKTTPESLRKRNFRYVVRASNDPENKVEVMPGLAKVVVTAAPPKAMDRVTTWRRGSAGN